MKELSMKLISSDVLLSLLIIIVSMSISCAIMFWVISR